MTDFGKLYADEAHKKKVLLEVLSERDAKIERLTRELAAKNEALTGMIAACSVTGILRRELAEAQRDALRWWRYVDPYDMYTEDAEAWERYRKMSEAAMEVPK